MLPEGNLREALTFDDVLLVPAKSDVLPKDVSLRTRLTKKVALNTPVVSSAMDTVTRAETAICMAREGGLGFIHKNLTIEEQVLEISKVKKAESGVVIDPVTISPDDELSFAVGLMKRHQISGLPVVGGDGRPVGILTNRDIRFEPHLSQPVSAVMTSKLITVAEGTDIDASKNFSTITASKSCWWWMGMGASRGLSPLRTSKKPSNTHTRPKTSTGVCGWVRRWALVPTGPTGSTPCWRRA